jgi:methionine synthase / methylenetetrahydrofolate reductase(NADPH)
VGPLGVRLEPLGKTGLDEARAAFAEQIRRALARGRRRPADYRNHARAERGPRGAEAARANRSRSARAGDGDGRRREQLPGRRLAPAGRGAADRVGRDAIGVNCSTGPATVLTAIEAMRAATTLPLAAMPNAGMPRAVEGRNIYLCSPEYMASFARKAIAAGVQIVGGCCGTTPNHIRAMRSAMRAIDAGARRGHRRAAGLNTETPPAPLGERSRIGALVAEGASSPWSRSFPRAASTAPRRSRARAAGQLGVHAINVPDSPRASARMSAQSLCIQIQQHTGIETILHYTCRDRNILSIQSDLLGASSIGLRNILCLTGDPPKLGNYPDATAVFDVDSIGLVNIVRRLNHGLDIGANAIGASTNFTIGVAANPGVPDIEQELRRFAYKVEAGAEYAITQPVFDLRLLESFLKRIEDHRIPVIAGIWPLTSLRNAEFMKNDLRVSMPEEIMLRMAQADTPDAARAKASDCPGDAGGGAPLVQGVQVSAPFGRYSPSPPKSSLSRLLNSYPRSIRPSATQAT